MVTEVVAAVLERMDAEGWAVLPGVLDTADVAAAREALADAAEESARRGVPTRMDALDPGGRNIRIHDLVEYSPLFVDLARHPTVLAYARVLLDDDVVLSNFTANTALPGSRSMNPHCDQSTIMPEPWSERWCFNAIWCLHDTDETNGATRFLPGSHRFRRFADVPEDPVADMRPFEAEAGSVILMDGRLWHTSGANVSRDRERALLFAFYARSFLRLQNSWWRSLSPPTLTSLDAPMKAMLGLDGGNMRYGTYLAER